MVTFKVNGKQQTVDLPLRDLVHCDPTRLCCISVADPGILVDMDTPDDYRRLGDELAKAVPRIIKGEDET